MKIEQCDWRDDLYALWVLGSGLSTNPNTVVEASLSCPCKPPQHVHGPSSIAVVIYDS